MYPSYRDATLPKKKSSNAYKIKSGIFPIPIYELLYSYNISKKVNKAACFIPRGRND